MDVVSSGDPEQGYIASDKDLEDFQRCPEAEKQLKPPLRGVLAEVALTGTVRYPWPLLRPLVTYQLEQVLTEFEAAEPGPSDAPAAGDPSSAAALLDRFRAQLGSFTDAPWTLQRLAELLLEPRRQYSRLHKLALAVEKLLLVTGELPAAAPPGPLPKLSEQGPVNNPPPRPRSSAANRAQLAGIKRQRAEEDELGLGLAAAALHIRPLTGISVDGFGALGDGCGPQLAGANGGADDWAAAAAAGERAAVDSDAFAVGAAAAAAAAAASGFAAEQSCAFSVGAAASASERSVIDSDAFAVGAAAAAAAEGERAAVDADAFAVGAAAAAARFAVDAAACGASGACGSTCDADGCAGGALGPEGGGTSVSGLGAGEAPALAAREVCADAGGGPAAQPLLGDGGDGGRPGGSSTRVGGAAAAAGEPSEPGGS